MKKLIILIYLFAGIHNTFAQSNNVDIMLRKIDKEKDYNIRIDIINIFFSNTAESDPLLDIKNAQRLLIYSQKNKDRISEAMALSFIGYDYKAFGNTAKSLEYDLKAEEIAQETGNEKLIVNTKTTLSHNYRNLADYPKAIGLLMDVVETGTKIKYDIALTWAYQSLAEAYISMNKIDSALKYGQMCYELSMRIHYMDYIGYTLLDLGAIHGKMLNAALAISYFDMAVQEGFRTKSSKQLNLAYTFKAQYFYDANQKDSSIANAKKAIEIVQNTPFSNYSIKPAKLLLDIYENMSSDSALKYFKIYRAANDSLYSTKIIQQTQLMTFENEVRQQELITEKTKVEEQRKQNIQYALIALSIISFIILFLLLSRSFITNTKLIEFFGVMALLIVFEFLNLLLHPFLENMTNHTPVFMLLTMVCIAALLVPIHHKAEKWATKKLVEKNKQIRLAAAKRTIRLLSDEKLENNQTN